MLYVSYRQITNELDIQETEITFLHDIAS